MSATNAVSDATERQVARQARWRLSGVVFAATLLVLTAVSWDTVVAFYRLWTDSYEYGHGLIVDCLIWRAAPDFLDRLGYNAASDLARVNNTAVERLTRSMHEWHGARESDAAACPVVIGAG